MLTYKTWARQEKVDEANEDSDTGGGSGRGRGHRGRGKGIRVAGTRGSRGKICEYLFGGFLWCDVCVCVCVCVCVLDVCLCECMCVV